MKSIFKPFFFQLLVLFTSFFFGTSAFAVDQTVVTAIAEDANYSWVGTHNGLWKINKSSNKVEHLTKENSLLPSNYVNAIAIEKDGNLWVGTANGILRYDRYAYYVLNTSNSSLPDNHITAIACTSTQDIVIGTFYEGIVVKIHNGKFIHYTYDNAPLINNSILSLTIDQNDNIWIGHLNAGATMLSNHNNWKVFNLQNGFTEKNVCFVTLENETPTFYTYNGNEVVFENGNQKIKEIKAFNGNQRLVYYSNPTEKRWVYSNEHYGVLSVGNNNIPDFRLCQKIKNNFFVSDKGISITLGNELVLK